MRDFGSGFLSSETLDFLLGYYLCQIKNNLVFFFRKMSEEK
jgi:hypothetical protein